MKNNSVLLNQYQVKIFDHCYDYPEQTYVFQCNNEYEAILYALCKFNDKYDEENKGTEEDLKDWIQELMDITSDAKELIKILNTDYDTHVTYPKIIS